MSEVAYKCIACTMELDETEFGDPRDADICGYCFFATLSDVRRRRDDGLANERELAMQATIEIRLRDALSRRDVRAIEIYEQLLRLIES